MENDQALTAALAGVSPYRTGVIGLARCCSDMVVPDAAGVRGSDIAILDPERDAAVAAAKAAEKERNRPARRELRERAEVISASR